MGIFIERWSSVVLMVLLVMLLFFAASHGFPAGAEKDESGKNSTGVRKREW